MARLREGTAVGRADPDGAAAPAERSTSVQDERLSVEEVTSAKALEALRGEWSALWEASAVATPFQTPEWLLAWWRHVGGEDGLWTLAVRDAGAELVGLAPLFVYRDGSTGTRQVTLLGNGVSDRLDALAAAGREDAVGRAVMEHLARSADAWDTCDFRDLPAGAILARAPAPALPDLRDERGDDEPAPALALPGDAAGLDEVVPHKLRKKLRYYRRRAEKEGEVRFESADDAEGGFDALFEALVRLHGRRWSERGESGVLDDDPVLALHREAAQGLRERGVLRIYGLRVGGRLAAVHYGFTAKGRAFYYLGGFDPELKVLSPGHLAVEHALRQAVREGARELSFLRGREAYKYHWGAEDRPGIRRRMARGGAPLPGEG